MKRAHAMGPIMSGGQTHQSFLRVLTTVTCTIDTSVEPNRHHLFKQNWCSLIKVLIHSFQIIVKTKESSPKLSSQIRIPYCWFKLICRVQANREVQLECWWVSKLSISKRVGPNNHYNQHDLFPVRWPITWLSLANELLGRKSKRWIFFPSLKKNTCLSLRMSLFVE